MQNMQDMLYLVPLFNNNKKPLLVEEYFGKVVDMLGDDENMKQYDEALRIDVSEQLSSGMVRDCGLSGLSWLVADLCS